MIARLTEACYHCIFFVDVLEHLREPGAILAVYAQFLKPDGAIIISAPNVAFALQRWLLLLGKFDYNSAGGIMDTFHLRFFTGKS